MAVREFPDPTPGTGEVVLQIKASGMCGSDLGQYRAAPGVFSPDLIGGHEPCGVVAAVGPCVPEALTRPGMRVMDHHYKGCGVCNHCRSGWSQLCRNGMEIYSRTAHGSHSEYMKVAASTLVPLPDELPLLRWGPLFHAARVRLGASCSAWDLRAATRSQFSDRVPWG